MALGGHVFLYCERGTSTALLAEPFNAASNGAFLLAALVGLQLLLWRPREDRSADHFLLIGLVFLIGLGSLAFHLFATTETALADVIPISLFMLVYLGFVLNRFLGVPPGWTVLLVLGFAGLIALTGEIKCGERLIAFPGAQVPGAKPCLNGSLFYMPALAALIVMGLLLKERGHRAAPYLLWAAAVFAVSVTFRSLDIALCSDTVFDGRKIGTHFLWHLLNALTLFLLLRASLEAGAPAAHQALPAVPAEVGQVPAIEEKPTNAEAVEQEELAPSPEVAAKEEPPAREPAVEDEPRPTFYPAADNAKDDAPEAESEPEAADEESKPKTFFPA
jgi:Ceramidase